MNERIKQLAEQATSTLSVNHEGYRGKGYIEQVEYFDKEKFAELIVLECADLVETQHTWITSVAASALIRKHFGVEE